MPVDKNIIAKEIKNLNPKKAVSQDDIPVKLLKLNNNIFSQYLSDIFKECIETADFPNKLKLSDITPVYKKVIDIQKKTIGLLMFYLLHLKYLNVVFMKKFTKTLVIYYQDTKCATERVKLLTFINFNI